MVPGPAARYGETSQLGEAGQPASWPGGHYESLPQDPGTHRLPLAKSARILSVISICSTGLTADSLGRADKPCTKEQLVRKLNDSITPYAQIKVDGGDDITSISELYAP